MKAQVYTVPDGIRLGTTSLRKQVEPMLRSYGFRVGTRLGEPVIRGGGRYADDTRDAWRGLLRFVGDTGYALKVETTSGEARALMAGGFVSAGNGTYRLVIRDNRVAVLYGHGRVG